jgi:hypothetical protein
VKTFGHGVLTIRPDGAGSYPFLERPVVRTRLALRFPWNAGGDYPVSDKRVGYRRILGKVVLGSCPRMARGPAALPGESQVLLC